MSVHRHHKEAAPPPEPAPVEKAAKVQFKLTIGLKEAHELIAMDKCGTSDPYVKVKVDGQTAYKTKTIMKQLDPVWNESCEIILDHLGQKIALSVYDYDRGSISDDFLGRVDVDILKLEHDKVVQHKLELSDKDSAINSGAATATSYRGFIIITTFLQRLGPAENKQEQSSEKHSIKISKPEFVKRMNFNNQTWRHLLEIVVGNVRDLRVPMFAISTPTSSTAAAPSPQSTASHFYLRIGYEGEWQRSKAISFPNSENVEGTVIVPIGEVFGFYIKSEGFSLLTVELCQSGESGNAIGEASIDIRSLSIEQTHKFEQRFSENCGYVRLTVSITGTRPDVIAAAGSLPAPTWSPGGPYLISPQFLRAEKETWMKELVETFAVQKSNQLPGDVSGVLVLKIFQAKNVIVADVNGKSDPFACVEIVNVRLRTHTEHKTLNPKWNRTFIIPIDDIHSIMTATVYDEDRDGKPDFLGKVVIPLLRLQKLRGERHWFALRSSRLTESSTPRGGIEIEGHLIYNKPRAILRALCPKEQSFLAKEEKVSIKLLQKDIAKVNKLVDKYFRIIDFLRDLMGWTDPKMTVAAIVSWIVTCFFFEPWMAPFALALIFVLTYFFASPEPHLIDEAPTPSSDQPINEPGTEDNKFSLTDKLNKLQEICLTVHRVIDNLTALYERLKNIVLWRSPWVSAAAMTAFLLFALLLFIIPLRWLMLIGGVYELAKKKVRPSAGFEAYDLISRAYTDGDMIKFRESKEKTH